MNEQLLRGEGHGAVDRRAFLRLGGLGALAAGLAACGSNSKSSTGSSSPSSTAAAASSATASSSAATTAPAITKGKVTYQLSWLENSEFAGTFIALDKGYYSQTGVNMDMLAGGPSLNTLPVLAAGRATITRADLDTTIQAQMKGADLRVLGAGYQQNPYCIVSLANAPITTPQEMIGKKIGVPASNTSSWNAFVSLNKIDPSKITVVPIGFSDDPLTAHQVDGLVGYSVNDPVNLQVAGVDTHYFLFEDFNYHLPANWYVVQASTLDDPAQRALIAEFFKAEAKGWQDEIASPAVGSDLAVQKYGKTLGLNAKAQLLQVEACIKLISTTWTKTHGLFTVPDDTMARARATLQASGLNYDPSKIYDPTVLQEVYADGPTIGTL